jgi:hypothetical protein
VYNQQKKKKEKKSYAGLVEQLQEGHGPFCNPSPRKLRERLLSPGKPGLMASAMILNILNRFSLGI